MFKGAVVSYDPCIKRDVLHVDGSLLKEQGAVNSATAVQMAEGVNDVMESRLSVAVTGIAGPGGAEDGKPVGTVFLGWAHDGASGSELCHFDGDREAVRDATVKKALESMLEMIEGAR